MALVKAKFVVDKTKKNIPVHFNPAEYSISVSPVHGGDENEKRNAIGVRGIETLNLKLYFDTYTKFFNMMDPASFSIPSICEDVRYYTEEIARLVSNESGCVGGGVSFIWGSLNFSGTIDSVSQKFTMFLDDGKPVRAEIDVKMTRKSAMNDVYQGTGARKLPDLTDSSWKLVVAGIVAAGKLRDILSR